MMSWKPILGMVVGSVLAVVGNSGAADPLVPTVVPPEMLAPKVAEHGLRLGAFDLHARMSGGMTYDDNITYSSTNRQSDLIGAIAPQISAVMDRRDGDYGTLLSLGYQPTVLLFSDHSNNDTIDQNVKSSFQWSGSKLTLGLSQAFVQTYGGVVEVGDRVRQKIYNTELTSKYALSEKTSIEVNPRLTVTDSDNYVGSRDWGVDTFLNHELGTKLTGSLGTTVG